MKVEIEMKGAINKHDRRDKKKEMTFISNDHTSVTQKVCQVMLLSVYFCKSKSDHWRCKVPESHIYRVKIPSKKLLRTDS